MLTIIIMEIYSMDIKDKLKNECNENFKGTL